jgi:hypothetical protein
MLLAVGDLLELFMSIASVLIILFDPFQCTVVSICLL